MRRQTMQYFFIFLIMVVSINLNFSSLAKPGDRPLESCHSGSDPPKKRDNSGPPLLPRPPPPPPCSSDPPPPPATRADLPPPRPPATRTDLSPPPSPSTGPPAKERVSPSGSQKVGKLVGLVFLGIAGVLQVGVVSFLVFKRWQINRKYCKLELSPSSSSRDG